MLLTVKSGWYWKSPCACGPFRSCWLAFCHLNKSIQCFLAQLQFHFRDNSQSDRLIYSTVMSHTFPGWWGDGDKKCGRKMWRRKGTEEKEVRRRKRGKREEWRWEERREMCVIDQQMINHFSICQPQVVWPRGCISPGGASETSAQRLIVTGRAIKPLHHT